MNKTFAVSTIAATLMCGISMAQTSDPSSSPSAPQTQSPAAQTQVASPAPGPAGATQAAAPNQPRIAPGSVIPVQLVKTVDAKKAKSGDEVIAKVTQDMKTQTGEILFPKDTKVIGHVTEAQARQKDQKESQLAIAFNQAVLKNQQVPVPMSIQAVIGQQSSNANSATAGDSAPASGGSTQSAPMGSRGSMGSPGQPQAQAPSVPPAADNSGAQQQSQGGKLPPINSQTQGIIGISNLTLAAAPNATQGSVLSSEKSNVKLESGTMLLLKVTQ